VILAGCAFEINPEAFVLSHLIVAHLESQPEGLSSFSRSIREQLIGQAGLVQGFCKLLGLVGAHRDDLKTEILNFLLDGSQFT